MSKLLKVLLLGCVLTLAAAVPALAQVSVEGERFNKPSGVSVAGGKGYSGGKALRIFSEKAIATKQVTITEASTVDIRARAGQTDGSPTLTLRVDGVNSGTRRIDSVDLTDYVGYGGVTLQPGTYTIGLKAGNVAQGRNVFVDVLTFEAEEVPDTTPPSTPIILSPQSSFEPNIDTSPTFTFSATNNETPARFSCELVDVYANNAQGVTVEYDSNCVSPKSYTGLDYGKNYSFRVRAYDAAGNASAEDDVWVTTPADHFVAKPAITSPADNSSVCLGTNTVISGTSDPTTDTVVLRGNTQSGASISGADETNNVDSQGNWSITATELTQAGTYTLYPNSIDWDYGGPNGYRLSGDSISVEAVNC